MWRALKTKDQTAEVHHVCSPRPEEAEFLQNAGIPFTALPVRNPHPLRVIGFIQSLITASRVFKTFQPDVVFSKGGGISVPVAIIAKLRGVPVILHESDAVSGKANVIVALWAKTICKGFPVANGESRMANGKNSRSEIRDARFLFTGNPVRPDVTQGHKEEGRKITGLDGSKPVLLVIGGSQGAQALNEAVVSQIDPLLNVVQIIHLTGMGKGTGIAKPGYWSKPFAYEELKHLYALSDLAVSRSGAGAITELAANGIPTILVPLRGVAHDHQQANALRAAESGGCVVVQQAELPTMLRTAVESLALDAQHRLEMSAKIRSLARTDAADVLAEVILQSVRGV